MVGSMRYWRKRRALSGSLPPTQLKPPNSANCYSVRADSIRGWNIPPPCGCFTGSSQHILKEPHGSGRSAIKIGRASCRERVCQCVDLGGRRIDKKKRNNVSLDHRGAPLYTKHKKITITKT